MAFERNTLLRNRYDLIRRPESAPLSNKDEATIANEKGLKSKDYAAFLKEQERKVGPDGFVDSGRYSYTYQRKRDCKQKGLDNNHSTPRASVVSLQDKIKKEEQNHGKCLKVIEDLMWQHKQEERELKRTEGDIVKNQQIVRHTLRDYEHAINKKKMAEAKKLSHSLDKYTVLQQDHVHNKEQLRKERTFHKIAKKEENNYTGRQIYRAKTDLARKYKTKVSEIELKRTEMLRLNQEFENKLKLKEEEQFRLKQEAADLALSLNMEAQKGRVKKLEAEKKRKEDNKNRIEDDLKIDSEFSSKLAKSDGDIKIAESTKRKLSADLSRTKTHLDIKKRDEQRHLIDTKIRLGGNISTQRQLNEAAIHVETNKKVQQLDQKIQEHNNRRIDRVQSNIKSKKEKQNSQQSLLEARFKKRYNEQQRKEHEDSLKFFQKMVSKDDEIEQNLYNKVRTSEYNRQKQEQIVRRYELNLAELKRKNAEKLKDEIIERNLQEKELEQKIQREKAELDKYHFKKEESYARLQKHRQNCQEDKYLLIEHEKEHNRLMRIGARTDSITV
ncbi:trichohyalin isoform X2 [Patella vulgata]|uniref:trichohyalin isoform X2 n=1 Tax=Patella vulgata TaxID=6465 RepID=UPI0021808AB6|nr:trichohyalin isoform X2 [Patella vulgata]